jgi:hypothetical protein
MNHREQEDLETWVTEVEMAHELISKMARGEVEIDVLIFVNKRNWTNKKKKDSKNKN